MLPWEIKRTDTFLRYLRKQRNNHELLRELDKKIERLKEDPFAVGGELAAPLQGKRSTRLSRTFRLIFSIQPEQRIVYLEALDHREEVYN